MMFGSRLVGNCLEDDLVAAVVKKVSFSLAYCRLRLLVSASPVSTWAAFIYINDRLSYYRVFRAPLFEGGGEMLIRAKMLGGSRYHFYLIHPVSTKSGMARR